MLAVIKDVIRTNWRHSGDMCVLHLEYPGSDPGCICDEFRWQRNSSLARWNCEISRTTRGRCARGRRGPKDSRLKLVFDLTNWYVFLQTDFAAASTHTHTHTHTHNDHFLRVTIEIRAHVSLAKGETIGTYKDGNKKWKRQNHLDFWQEQLSFTSCDKNSGLANHLNYRGHGYQTQITQWRFTVTRVVSATLHRGMISQTRRLRLDEFRMLSICITQWYNITRNDFEVRKSVELTFVDCI